MVLVDTAGLRRRTKVAGTVDYYAQLRSERAADRAEVAIVVCDAAEGLTTEDLHIAEMAMKEEVRDAPRPQQVGCDRTDLEEAKARVHAASSACARRDGHVPRRRRTRRHPAARAALGLADRAGEWIPTPSSTASLADSRRPASRPWWWAASACGCTTWRSSSAPAALRGPGQPPRRVTRTMPTSSRTGCVSATPCREFRS